MKRLSVLLLLFSILLLPQAAVGAIDLNLEYPPIQGLNLATNQGLDDIIAWFYYFIVTISGFAAFVMLVWGGIEWLGSAANPGLQSQAKDRIKNALYGLVLVVSSVLILQIINPELTILQVPGLQ